MEVVKVEQKKSFDENWEITHSTKEWGQYPTEHIIRFVARNYYRVEDRSKIKILDFGCGAGAHTWYLAREGFDTYAFDGSESAIERVRKKLKIEGGYQADLRVRDALQLDYPKDFFDAVIDNVCIFNHLVEYIDMMYTEVYEILKTGGKFISVCFGKNTQGYGTGKELEPGTYSELESGMLAGRTNIHFFDKEELQKALEKVGFSEVLVDTINYTDNGNKVELLVAQGKK